MPANLAVKNSWDEWNDLSGNYLPRRMKERIQVPTVDAPPKPARQARPARRNS